MNNLKIKLSLSLFLIFALVFIKNSGITSAQILAGYSSPSTEKTVVIKPISTIFKITHIYNKDDNSRSINFDIPYETNASINIASDNGSIVKSYLYENIYAGSYMINLDNSDFMAGKYNVTLRSGDNTQTLNFVVE